MGMVAKNPNGRVKLKTRELPRINFRPLLFCVIGLVFGVFLYLRIRFGGVRASDFLFLFFFVPFALLPLSLKRALTVLLTVVVAAGAGAALTHLYTENFLSGKEENTYEISGTVQTFTEKNGFTGAVLSGLSFDGEGVGGKLYLTASGGNLRAGDRVTFVSSVRRTQASGEDYHAYHFANDIRYTASASVIKREAGSNPFLRLNGALYDALHEHMEKTDADVSYALLSGSSGSVDEELMTSMRQGGIAHIFAVSGLHIGILYAAVQFLFRRLKRLSFLPALLITLFYAATCGFTVSAIRAVIMSGVVGIWMALGRKADFLNALSLAAILVLAIFPAQWLTAGFRLSFGACVGIALFSGTLTRAMKKLPSFLSKYLAASFAVQIFTLPILLEAFGYLSVWGTLLNLLLVPLLPVLFLGVLLCTVLALVIPPAAGFFLMFPEGSVSLLVLFFTVADLSLVITGFSLGAGSGVWLVGAAGLSERVRLSRLGRTIFGGVTALLFSLIVVFHNIVVSGCKITVYSGGLGGNALLVQTRSENVLVIDGDISLPLCEDFLARTFSGVLTAVCVLSEDGSAVNVAAFLPANEVRMMEEVDAGLRDTALVFGEEFSYGELFFHYESKTKLALRTEGVVVEIDFENPESLGADLFVQSGDGGLKYYLNHGIIKAL